MDKNWSPCICFVDANIFFLPNSQSSKLDETQLQITQAFPLSHLARVVGWQDARGSTPGHQPISPCRTLIKVHLSHLTLNSVSEDHCCTVGSLLGPLSFPRASWALWFAQISQGLDVASLSSFLPPNSSKGPNRREREQTQLPLQEPSRHLLLPCSFSSLF